ncbi:hypothetical protein [Streptomyces sp. NPDC057877]|uniref:hypothetical protein n=1 Tax=Streptomyces sp. NPDC057877 TaxID=3346269 RepID=UPI003698F8BD
MRHRRTARALAAATVLLIASGLYATTHTPWLCVFGFYAAAVAAWCSARYAAAHRRWLAEQAWERRHVLGERPAPLDPCCHLARHSGGAAHDRRRCTDLFHRITADLAAHHPTRSSL